MGGVVVESVGVVELGLLSQGELMALSRPKQQDGDAFPIPKIDRSVFNESAGSRKQTYSRLRLAPSASVAAARRNRAAVAAAAAPDRDERRVLAYLEQLFGSHALVPVTAKPEGRSCDFSNSQGRPRRITDGTSFDSVAGEKRKRGRPRKNPAASSQGLGENQPAIESP